MVIKDVTDLEVYRLSLELMKVLYEFLRKIPITEYDSVKQSKKCAKSIPANIAEGFAKRHYQAEFKRFLLIALGSSDELITHIRTIVIAVPRLTQEGKVLAGKYVLLSKKLNSLHRNWNINNYR